MTTSPTPPIELNGHASHFHGEGVDLDDDFVAALVGDLRGRHRRRCGGRSEPRLVAAGAALVDRRRGAATGRPRRAAGDHRPGGRCRPSVQHRPGPAHRRRRAQRRVRGSDPGPRRCRARHDGAVGRRVGRRRVGDRGGDGRHVRARSRGRSPGGPRPVGRPLPTELRPRDGRRVGGVARCWSVLDALRQDRSRWWSGSSSCSPTARSCVTGGAPAGAVGPDLTQLVLGSEGTLAVITKVWLRTHPLPAHEARAAYSFPTFGAGIDACRSTLRAGATPAVLRLYDAEESARGRGGDGTTCTMVVLDEGDGRAGRCHDGDRRGILRCRGWRTRRCRTGRRMDGAPQRHDGAPSAHPPGIRGRHDGDRRALVGARHACSTTSAGRSSPCRRRAPPRVICRTATPTAPASTSPSPRRRRRTTSRRPTSRCGTPASGPCSPVAGTCRTTMAWGSTAPGSSPRHSAPATACCNRSNRRSTRKAS